MSDIKYALTKTLNILNNCKLTFGSFTFSLWQMMLAFMALSLFVWFIRNLFSDSN